MATKVSELTPMGDRLLVKQETETKSEAGLIIPDNVQKKSQVATVVAVSDDLETVALNEGDRVVFARYAGTEVQVGGEDMLLLDGDDVLGTLHE